MKLVGMKVTPEVFGAFMRSGERTLKVKSDLPETAEFHHAYYDHERVCFVVVFRDVSFRDLEEGEYIPIVPPAQVQVIRRVFEKTSKSGGG